MTMTLTKEQVLEQCKQAVAASDANGLHVLAMIAGVIRQVAPSSVAVPETSVEPLPVEPVAEPPVAPYRFILNVPEINDYKG